MASTITPADGNEMGNQWDSKSPFKEICSHSTGNSTSCFPCSPSALEINSEFTRSPLNKFGQASSETNPLLGMLMSHFAGAFTQLELIGPESSLSARLNNFEKLANDQLSSGAVFLRKSPFIAAEDSPNITEIQITWEKGKPDKESEVGSLTAPDATSFYNNLDSCLNYSGSIQPFTVYYKLTLESYTGHDDDAVIHHSSSLSEIATKIHGDLYHRSGGRESHWTIRFPRFRSPALPRNGPSKRYVNIPVSYNYGFYHEETLLCVVIQINMCTTTIIQLSLQDIDHNALETSVDSKANQFDVDTQASMYHQRLFLKADCRGFSKREGTMKHEIMSSQQERPDKVKAAICAGESSAAQKNPETWQYQARRKPVTQRENSGELESDELGGKTTPSGNSSKNIRVSDNTGGLACPFYKMNPWKFDRCLTYKLTKMSYVKQHLLRFHDAPRCNCSRRHKAGRDCPSGSQDCQQSEITFCVMTAKQKREIQRAAGRKITCEGKWYQVWSILFPDVKKPDSPYVKGHYFAEVLSSIKAFYDSCGSHVMEETFRQAMKDTHTYREAFDELLKKIEHQVLTRSSSLGSSFHFDSSIETEGADWLVARRSPSVSLITNNNEFSILDDQNPIPIPSSSVIMDDRQEALVLGNSPGMLPCNPKPQEIPFIHGLGLGPAGDSPFHQLYQPMPHQNASSLNPEPQDTVNYNDDTIGMFGLGAVSDFTYSVHFDAGFCDWVAEMPAGQHQVVL
ncbi:hypothetical protein F4680DRAFT_439472 [Xylaria scruposa]|nr:hypothetical protein F4680DRAFT_439472 [Xylaria scruposa]